MSVGFYNFAGFYKTKIMQNSQNRTKDYRFSIVVPVYNEQENMPALENRLSNFLSHSIYPACVIFLNDGSKDDSSRCIHEICSRHNDFFYLDFEQNAGLSAAAARGRKGGRKPVVTAEKLQRAREHIANGLNVREAAVRLKIGKTALYAALQTAGSTES